MQERQAARAATPTQTMQVPVKRPQAVWVSLNPPTVSPELTRRSAEARAEAVAAASTVAVAVAEALGQVWPRAAEGEG